jgi:hypothetical protein
MAAANPVRYLRWSVQGSVDIAGNTLLEVTKLNKIVILSLSLLLLLVLIPGCFTFQNSPPNPIQTVGTPPVIGVFSNNPATMLLELHR